MKYHMKKMIIMALLMGFMLPAGFAQDQQTEKTKDETQKTKMKENDRREKDKKRTEDVNGTRKDKSKDKKKDNKDTAPAVDTSSPLGIINQPG